MSAEDTSGTGYDSTIFVPVIFRLASPAAPEFVEKSMQENTCVGTMSRWMTIEL
jgi:hypothetical protein